MSAADLCLALALSALLSVVVAAAQYMRAEIAEAEVERLTDLCDEFRKREERVESLAGQWERLATTAINPDSREWLQACAATLRECLSGWQKMHAASKGADQ